MKKNFYIIVITILVVIESISIFLMWKSSTAKETLLDDVRLIEIVNNENVAIMIEKSDGSGYEESTSKVFPTNMTFNSEKSGCIDSDGMKTGVTITFTNGKATIETGATSHCYLYFDL